MRAVVQRVASAGVRVDDEVVGRIGPGLVVFLGVADGDTDGDAAYVAGKVAGLRIFEDPDGRMNRSVGQEGGGVLAVSQFTLLGDARKGRRPSFVAAAEPAEGRRLYERFVQALSDTGLEVATGRFGARMRVEVQNDGPVTILLDSRKRF